MRVVFIIDDLRHDDLCFELNGIERKEDDIVIIARNARSAVMSLTNLAQCCIPIDIMMLDHDLGDGLDTSWFLNWLLGMASEDDIQYLETPLKWVGDTIKQAKWYYHTSNIATIPSMQAKVKQIQNWLDNNIADV